MPISYKNNKMPRASNLVYNLVGGNKAIPKKTKGYDDKIVKIYRQST